MIRMLRAPLLSLCKPKVWNSLSLYMQSLTYISFKEPELKNLHVMLAGAIGVVVGYSTWDSWTVLPCKSHALCLFLELWFIGIQILLLFWEEPICWIFVSLSGCKCNSGYVCVFVCLLYYHFNYYKNMGFMGLSYACGLSNKWALLKRKKNLNPSESEFYK